ncbi:nucleoid-associated protein [Confluentibacter sediminis]|uniref:nucleoid-associated protein n=1 Tax=Confluentibacter sediminis TaxID=2219045 RepID=UPI000DAD4818|nr:nucleoid-associated protein [Confluentibacter sediminis]
MKIKRLTIHQIEKNQGVLEAHLTTSDGLISVDEEVIFLSERLNDTFRKDEKVIRTEFLEDEDLFQKSLKDFASKKNDKSFYEFSKSSILRVKKLLQSSNFATGGYFVFINYEYRKSEYVGVFIVRDSEEVIFNKKGQNTFVVNKTTVINTDKLAMAVRVDIGRLSNKEDRYLQFTHKLASTSNYFSDWIEANLLDRSADDTKALIKLIDDLTEFPIDPETGVEFDSEMFREKVFNYINSSGRVVRLRELGKTFWDNSDFLTTYIDEHGINMNHEFQAVNVILSRLKKYEIKSGKIKLTFSRADIESGRVDIGNNNQIIITNETLRAKFDELND